MYHPAAFMRPGGQNHKKQLCLKITEVFTEPPSILYNNVNIAYMCNNSLIIQYVMQLCEMGVIYMISAQFSSKPWLHCYIECNIYTGTHILGQGQYKIKQIRN